MPYDQLTGSLGPLSRESPDELGIVLIESSWKAGRRPYHKQKLALVLANQRHFALEQARRGVAVHYITTDRSFGRALRDAAGALGTLRVMEPAERELRIDLSRLVEEGLLDVVSHEGWLTTAAQFDASQPGGSPYRMDRFYRQVRRDSGILMDGDRPVGGKFSYDAENRKPWRGDPPAPAPPVFRPDAITREVVELVRSRFARHPGSIAIEQLPATLKDAERLWGWARSACLPFFGPFEDAMSSRSRSLFHTRLSPLLNLHRLTPARVLDDVLHLDLPLASQEGFVRQLLGWREFVRHVHVATDGFRTLDPERSPADHGPGDGGWHRWSGRDWGATRGGGSDGGASPSFLESRGPLPPVYWGTRSGLRCLDTIVDEVWSEGYTHHIPRLMVLANLATLLDVDPREITDWFWVAFADAYDWVVEPNVLGMGTFAVGDLMTTKPYVCGAAYIDRMGDYCAECPFDPKKDCPITSLYWDFLARKRSFLEDNPRLRLPLRSLEKRGPERKAHDEAVSARVLQALRSGSSVEA